MLVMFTAVQISPLDSKSFYISKHFLFLVTCRNGKVNEGDEVASEERKGDKTKVISITRIIKKKG